MLTASSRRSFQLVARFAISLRCRLLKDRFPSPGPLTTCRLDVLFPLSIAFAAAQVAVHAEVTVARFSENRLPLGTSRNGTGAISIPGFFGLSALHKVLCR
jgi:hypothetical protein